MKRVLNLIVITLAIVGLTSCNNNSSDNVTVQLQTELPINGSAKLIYLGVEKASTFDSVKIENATISELSGYLQQPALFALRVQGWDDIFLVIHPNEEVVLNVDNTFLPVAYTVEGSVDSRLVNEIMTKQSRVRQEITNLSLEYEASKQTPESFHTQKIKFDSIYDNLLRTHKQNTIAFINTNSTSLACVFALYQDFGQQKRQPLFDIYNDIEVFNKVDSNLSLKYPQTEAVIALNRDVVDINAKIKHKQYAEKLVVPGKKAPDFIVTTIDKKKISLKDFENEAVVYVFFAVWNKPSLQTLEALNDLKQKYAYRKLNVVAISLDSDATKLQAYIEEKNIKLPVACDYQYWQSDYVTQFGINRIPDVILLDNNHIINNRSIDYTELIQILSEWKKSILQ